MSSVNKQRRMLVLRSFNGQSRQGGKVRWNHQMCMQRRPLATPRGVRRYEFHTSAFGFVLLVHDGRNPCSWWLNSHAFLPVCVGILSQSCWRHGIMDNGPVRLLLLLSLQIFLSALLRFGTTHAPFVLLQMGALLKRTAALIALVRSVIRVRAHVADAIRHVGKPSCTVFPLTRIRFLIRMGAYVLLQGPRLSECLLTRLALERLLPRMDPHVDFQIA